MKNVIYNVIYFETVWLVNFISSYFKLLEHFIFALSLSLSLLIEGYEKFTLWKELVIAPFVERFKTATLRSSDW